MTDDKNAVNTSDSAANQPSVTEIDYEADIAALKTREAKLIEERDNWKTAALKYKGKAKSDLSDDEDDERIKIAAKEALAESHLADIARELDAMNRKALKENKELKLAMMNKKQEPNAALGGHSEVPPVPDTTITPEQMAVFRSKGWDDKKIEMYKRNLARYAHR